jgi:hypothetical protein
VLIGATRLRRAMRAGRRFPQRAGTDLLLPRTPQERRLVVLFAITAGVTEEAIFRALLIGAGHYLYGLPLPVAIVLSLALFAAGHGLQGRPGVIGAALFGLAFTMIYVLTGSLLLVVVAHIWQDLVALLVVPRAEDTPPATDAPVATDAPTADEAPPARETGAPPAGPRPLSVRPPAPE